MTLDVYWGGPFDDYLHGVAEQSNQALPAEWYPSGAEPSCPSKTRTNRHWPGQTISEPPRGIEPRTYALRASPVHDGGRRLVWCEAGPMPDSPGLVTVDDG
jgi:hypothetical protein